VGIEWKDKSSVNIVSMAKPVEPNSMLDSREQKVPLIMFMLIFGVQPRLPLILEQGFS